MKNPFKRNKSIKELRLEKLGAPPKIVPAIESTQYKRKVSNDNNDFDSTIIDTVVTEIAIDIAESIFSGGGSDDSGSGGGDFSGGGGDFSGGGASGEF